MQPAASAIVGLELKQTFSLSFGQNPSINNEVLKGATQRFKYLLYRAFHITFIKKELGGSDN
jgi:hypothetical protein